MEFLGLISLKADILCVSNSLLEIAHMANLQSLELDIKSFADAPTSEVFASLMYHMATESPAVRVSCGGSTSTLASNISEFKARLQKT